MRRLAQKLTVTAMVLAASGVGVVAGAAPAAAAEKRVDSGITAAQCAQMLRTQHTNLRTQGAVVTGIRQCQRVTYSNGQVRHQFIIYYYWPRSSS